MNQMDDRYYHQSIAIPNVPTINRLLPLLVLYIYLDALSILVDLKGLGSSVQEYHHFVPLDSLRLQSLCALTTVHPSLSITKALLLIIISLLFIHSYLLLVYLSSPICSFLFQVQSMLILIVQGKQSAFGFLTRSHLDLFCH